MSKLLYRFWRDGLQSALNAFVRILSRQSQQKSSDFLVCWYIQEASMANSVAPDQTAPRSSLFWVHAVCFYT